MSISKDEELINTEVLDQVKDLMDDGDPTYPETRSMIDILFQKIDDGMSTWPIYMENNNTEEIARQTHSLKGSAPQLGVNKLNEYFVALANINTNYTNIEDKKQLFYSIMNTIKANNLVERTRKLMYASLVTPLKI